MSSRGIKNISGAHQLLYRLIIRGAVFNVVLFFIFGNSQIAIRYATSQVYYNDKCSEGEGGERIILTL